MPVVLRQHPYNDRYLDVEISNNVDLLSCLLDQRILVEAKSLIDAKMAVDRMRYAIGQLADYEKRYQAKLESSRSAVAFGNPLGRDEDFVGEVLDSKGIALLVFEEGRMRARNRAAEQIALLR